jgi:thiamine biosynthesis protein ThiI
MEEIGKAAVEYMLRLIEKKGIRTFKVDAKRADKSFPVKSPDIARQMEPRC